MTVWSWPRCYCGHPYEAHRHFRPGHDCGSCGVTRCYRYVGRDQPLPASHVEAAALNDAHMWRNLWALSGLLSPPAGLRAVIPAPRAGPERPVAAWLEHKRARNRRGSR